MIDGSDIASNNQGASNDILSLGWEGLFIAANLEKPLIFIGWLLIGLKGCSTSILWVSQSGLVFSSITPRSDLKDDCSGISRLLIFMTITPSPCFFSSLTSPWTLAEKLYSSSSWSSLEIEKLLSDLPSLYLSMTRVFARSGVLLVINYSWVTWRRSFVSLIFRRSAFILSLINGTT